MKTYPTSPALTQLKRCSAAALLLLLPGIGLTQSSFDFKLSVATVYESDRVANLSIVRGGVTNTTASVDYSTVDGTAIQGLKYTTTAGTLQFAPGETNRQISVPIINDGFAGGTKTFQVILRNPSQDAVLGAKTNVTVSIIDYDLGVQFIGPTNSVSEGAGVCQVLLVRTEDGGQPVTVDVLSTDVTAKAGVDYMGIATNVAFAPAESAKFIAVAILNNGIRQPPRSFKLTLANATGASLGPQTNLTVTILDDDQGFRFEATGVSVGEDAGAVPIAVLRGSDDTSSAVTVDIYTTDASAISGSDYLGVTNTLSFAPGEVRKVVAVPLINDGIKEVSKTFRVYLDHPSSGMQLGSPAVITVTVIDNDPQLGFQQSSYTNEWESTNVALTVLRGNDAALGVLTVDYATADLAAKAGTDYQAVSGTLRFEPNESVKTLLVPIIVSRPTAGGKSFRVTLSNPSGGAILGTSATIVNLQGVCILGPRFTPDLAMTRDSGFNLVTWLGDGQLERADRPTGPWQSLGKVKSPVPISSVMPASFYRIRNPRPVNLYVPAKYDGQTPMPLVIALHGFTSNGQGIDSYFGLTAYAASRGFLYCCPDGLMKPGGLGWNAWFDNMAEASAYNYPWCDDVGFVRGIIEEVGKRFALDRKRVYLIGHSNGGGMAHFGAVRCADLVAGIASLAGNPAIFYPAPTEPVNILHIHGTADQTVPYNDTPQSGPPYSPVFPGAMHIAQIWAALNGAKDPVTEPKPSLDLDNALAGLDTVITRWTNAPPGGAVEVWTINNGSHVPSPSANFTPKMLDWLMAHPKP